MKTLKAMLKDKNVASIAATSGPAVKKILEKIDFSNTTCIVEYGAGSGPITKALLAQMREDSKLYAFETNNDLIEELKHIKDPRLHIIHDTAEKISNYISSCDYIISGIPFSLIEPNIRTHIIQQSYTILKYSFITYQTTTQLKKDLKAFHKVHDTFVAFNLPPLFIITATKH